MVKSVYFIFSLIYTFNYLYAAILYLTNTDIYCKLVSTSSFNRFQALKSAHLPVQYFLIVFYMLPLIVIILTLFVADCTVIHPLML